MTSKYSSLRKGTKTKKWSWKYLCLDTWFPEIAATLFSIACFVGIYGTLKAYDQKSRPEFYYGLSLNAIVSVLATSCKSSLIFVIGEAMGQLKWVWFDLMPKQLVDIQTLDSASRGPFGSIASLFRKTRRSIASLGAAVIVLLLAFDPFVQQIIHYPTRLTAIRSDPSAAIAKKLDYFAPSTLADFDYNTVYSAGLWSDDVMPSPDCSSGNCTWRNFQSTGMCSQCSDITKSLDLKCESIGDILLPVNHPNTSNALRYRNVTCHITPPQGNSTQFETLFVFSESEPASWIGYNTPGISWHIYSAYGGNQNGDMRLKYSKERPFIWPGNSLMVVGYAEMGYNEDYLDADLTSGFRVDKATECSLELCLLEYEVSVENGIPNILTSVLDYGQLSWINMSDPTISNDYPTLCWKPTSSPALSNVTIDQLGPAEFTFCDVSMISLHENVFVGSMTESHTQYSDSSRKNDEDRPYGDPNALRIHNLGLEKVMSNVAKHMNKEALRANGSDVHGIAYTTEVYVEVKWPWLILPTILVASGTIFIAIVIKQEEWCKFMEVISTGILISRAI